MTPDSTSSCAVGSAAAAVHARWQPPLLSRHSRSRSRQLRHPCLAIVGFSLCQSPFAGSELQRRPCPRYCFFQAACQGARVEAVGMRFLDVPIEIGARDDLGTLHSPRKEFALFCDERRAPCQHIASEARQAHVRTNRESSRRRRRTLTLRVLLVMSALAADSVAAPRNGEVPHQVLATAVVVNVFQEAILTLPFASTAAMFFEFCTASAMQMFAEWRSPDSLQMSTPLFQLISS